MKRWGEHYQQLYYRENIITDTAVETTSLLPVMNELYVPPSVGEPRGAINSLAFGKAPVNDGIPSEAIKAGMNTALLYSAGRKEQCPGHARLQHHHALQEQGRLQQL